MINKNTEIEHSLYKIGDPKRALSRLFIAVFFVALAVISLMGSYGLLWVIFFLLVAALYFLKYQQIKEGYLIDLSERTFSFPASYASANSISELFSPEYISRVLGLKRITVPVSDIREISSYYSGHYYVRINGNFGAYQLCFKDKGKRDELYSLIVQINNMGTPVVNR